MTNDQVIEKLGTDWLAEAIARWPGYGVIYGTQREEAPDPKHSARDLAVLLAEYGYHTDELPGPQDVPGVA